jgi:methylated-DNA-[protein]-cysteine S-methyltransferase
MYFSTTHASPLGLLTLLSDGESLNGLWMERQMHHGASMLALIDETGKMDSRLPIFQAAKEWLDRYFSGQKPEINELSLAPAGSAFRQGVWDILCTIPYGQTTTYGAIAKTMAERTNKEKMASQAVGGAVGHNPISIIIPCHRVVGANGNLTGYGGGLDTKVKLLELEGVDMSAFFMPKMG